jgi:hypothetical protein
MDSSKDNIVPILVLTIFAFILAFFPWIGLTFGITGCLDLMLSFNKLIFLAEDWAFFIPICSTGIALGVAIYQKHISWILGNIYLLVFNFFGSMAGFKVLDKVSSHLSDCGANRSGFAVRWIYITNTLHMDTPRDFQDSLIFWMWAIVCALALFVLTRAIILKPKKYHIKTITIIISVIMLIMSWAWFCLMCIFELPT